jgi:hypothetical protein
MDLTNSKASLQNDLIRNREESSAIKTQALRSHGKLWGMDAFSWFVPATFELENTLHSFPFPVIWFCSETEFKRLTSQQLDWMAKIKVLCVYDAIDASLIASYDDQVELAIITQTLEEALEKLKILKTPRGVFLFTAAGENWENHKRHFDAFIELQQGI